MSLEDEGDAVRRFYRGLTALRLEVASEIVDDLTKLARAAFTAAEDGARRAATGEATAIIKDCWGALNFILAFYEPGQRYLDTNAWKQAEASGRRAHAKARAYIDALATAATPKTSDEGQNTD